MDVEGTASDHSADAERTAPSWSDLLPASAARDPWPGLCQPAIAHLGDADDETRHLLSGRPALVPLLGHGALRLVGADRVDFLHGLVSHDVRGLAAGEGRAALLLDHRGRPRAAVSVVRRPDDLYLAVDDAAVGVVREVLEAHIVFDDVRVQDLSDVIASFVLSGEAAVERMAQMLALRSAPASGDGSVAQHALGSSDVIVHARERGLARSLDVHMLRTQVPTVLSALRAVGVRAVGERALAAARVAAGIPAAAFEGAEALPQETGLEDRVSYRKGCYLGQEIMARVEARGSVRRGLARLVFDAAPGLPEELDVRDAAGRTVGRIGTATSDPEGVWRALAVLRRDVDHSAALVALGAAARLERFLA